MKNLLKILSVIVLLFMYDATHAQEERVVVELAVGGFGHIPENKRIIKFIRLVDADTKRPVVNYNYTIVGAYGATPISGGTTDSAGYAKLYFTMANYYKKVEINLNDGRYLRIERKEDKAKMNTIPYKPINKTVTFPSKKEKIDTVTVFIKKI